MKKIFSIIAASLCMVSCVDTVILPDDKIVDEDMWQTKSDVSGMVACAYNQLKDESLMRNYIIWGDFRSDELMVSSSAALTNGSAFKVDLSQIYSLNILPSNAFTNWNALYSAINYCNLVMERAHEVIAIDPNYTEGDYLTDISKVKALRALCYFYLVRVFRDVPVSTKAYTSSDQDTQLEQKAPAEVLAMCIQDLKEAEVDAMSSSTYGDWRDKGYMTRDAICALLADIYLWRASVNHDAADYQACIDYCDKVIASKKNAHVLNPRKNEVEQDYYLASAEDYYNEVFSTSQLTGGSRKFGQNSEESILEVQYTSGTSSIYRRNNNSGLVQMYYIYNNKQNGATPYLKTTSDYAVANGSSVGTNFFKNTVDVRRKEFIYDADNTANDQYLVRKFIGEKSYMNESPISTSSSREVGAVYSNWILYRLTDVMLMKAEAMVQIYEMTEKNEGNAEEMADYLRAAFDIVDFVNRRALPEGATSGFLSYNLYKDQMEKLVLMERARELCFEGKRWFDLMRYNYRHVEGVQYDKTFAQIGGGYVQNYSDMLTMAIGKKYSSTAMASKMPTEPYLYWPINTAQMDVNDKLVQNPVWRSSSSTERN